MLLDHAACFYHKSQLNSSKHCTVVLDRHRRRDGQARRTKVALWCKCWRKPFRDSSPSWRDPGLLCGGASNFLGYYGTWDSVL